MGKHATHRVPTCKKCGTEHYNMRPCPEVVEAPERPGLLTVVNRPGVRRIRGGEPDTLHTGAFKPGRIDKHPGTRIAVGSNGGNA